MFQFLLVANVLSALVLYEINAARILCVFPTPSFSHHIVYRILTQALANRGHDVVVITTHPFPPGETPANLTEIDMYDVSHHLFQEAINKVYHETGDDMRISKIYCEAFTKIFERQLQSKPVQDIIKSGRDRFDLLFLESNIWQTLGLLNVFDAPAIQTSTFGPMPVTYPLFGGPIQPLLYPIAAGHQNVYNLTWWEAMQILYKTTIFRYMIYSREHEDNKMLRENLGFNIMPLTKLYERVHLFFQTVYPIWMNNPPLPPGIVYLGGLHQKPPKTLPQDIQTIIDKSESGIVYVSFGSNVHPSHLSQEKIDMMARVFSKLPYKVLWKRDKSIETEIAKNIHVSSWFPQSDLLHNPNIKLFITQGGLQSTEEAITAGVPLIGIPIFGDQWLQTANYVRFKIGLQLDWNMLTEEEFTRSIENVIEDNSYKENVVRLGTVLNDQPQTALERALWWTEYILKHGSTHHLLPASANMSWTQYFEVELIILVVGVILFVFIFFTFCILRLVRCVCTRRRYRRHSKII